MAGPISSVFFETIPTEQTWREIENVINNISDKVEGNDFWVTSTEFINGSVKNIDARPFGIEKHKIDSDYSYYSEKEILMIKDYVGFNPKFDLGFYAMCNREIDHKILGELSLYIAEKFDGLINFGGAIYPFQSLPNKMKEGMWLWEEANWTDIKPYFEEMVEKISGKIFSIEYETENKRNWVYHLCDAEFMKNWLQSKYFGMVK